MKTNAQIHWTVTVQLISSLYFLNPKFQASCHLLWLDSSGTHKQVFSQHCSYIHVLYRCGVLACLSILLLILDVGQRDRNEALMSLPAWKLSLVTTMVVSISLKILSTTQVSLFEINYIYFEINYIYFEIN